MMEPSPACPGCRWGLLGLLAGVYHVSWLCVWWCLWRFCSWSCRLHTLHTYPPASRSRPRCRSPLSVYEDTEWLTHEHVELSCSRTHVHDVTHLALSTHTHTVQVFVWAACAIQDHPLHRHHILGLLGLAMQVAAFVSWEINTNTG